MYNQHTTLLENIQITVGISFFNAQEYLEQAILSVVNQTIDNWILILVNDGSTDDSLTIANSYKSDKIFVYSDGSKKGLSDRLNEIASLTRTKYLARMDADDIMHPERLEQQLKFLISRPDIDVVGSGLISIDDLNLPQGFRNNTVVPQDMYSVLKRGIFYHPTIVGKKEWFTLNKYDFKYNRIEDLELWARTFKRSKFYILKENLLFYREVNVPYLNKYLQTSYSFRKIVDNYSSELSLTEKLLLYFTSYTKDFIYKVAFFLRVESFLIKLRNADISEKMQVELTNIINKAIKK